MCKIVNVIVIFTNIRKDDQILKLSLNCALSVQSDIHVSLIIGDLL